MGGSIPPVAGSIQAEEDSDRDEEAQSRRRLTKKQRSEAYPSTQIDQEDQDCDDIFEDWILGSEDGEDPEREVEADAQPGDPAPRGTDVDSVAVEAQSLRTEISMIQEKIQSYITEEDRIIVSKLILGVDVTELYSPVRVAEACRRMGLKPGSSMDIRTGYDFNKRDDRNRAYRTLIEEDPEVLIACPPCTLFSSIQGINVSKHGPQWEEDFLRRRKDAEAHLEFAAKMCLLQHRRGKHFVFEHPASATSWSMKSLVELKQKTRACTVLSHQCQFGVTTVVDGERGLVKKPTKFLTSSWCIAKSLYKLCSGGHRHHSIMEGRAAKAAEYPEKLSRAMCQGLIDQLACDKNGIVPSGMMTTAEVLSFTRSALEREVGSIDLQQCRDHVHEPESEQEQLMKDELLAMGRREGRAWASDDVKGNELDPERVAEARRLEIEWFNSRGVYTKVPRVQSKGHKVIRCRWVDANKGDIANPDYRSRLVGKEFANEVDPDPYASMPPLEGLRFVVSTAATSASGNPERCLMVNDISRAYFFAPAARELYVELPPEDMDPMLDLVGRLNWSLYGTRDAARNWADTVGKKMQAIGFQRGIAFPAIYVHPERRIVTVVHGDDFTSSGTEEDLLWLRDKLSEQFETKTNFVGHKEGMPEEGKVLNRILRATAAGFELEADPRHAEMVIEKLGLQAAKGVVTPGTDEQFQSEEVNLQKDEITDYRSLAARLSYLSADRPDIQFAVKESCRTMSSSTNHSRERLTRVAKYLIMRPRLIWIFKWQGPDAHLEIWCDANWAGCKLSRKSTSGGAIKLGTHTLRTYSKTQSNIALSSAESELYAMVKAASEGLGIMTMIQEFGKEVKLVMHVDASAALGIAQREGLGKLRHLQTNVLWLQSQSVKRALKMSKVDGTKNPSDVQTKHVSRESIEKRMSAISCEFRDGRASSAAQLHSLRRTLRQLRHRFKSTEAHAIVGSNPCVHTASLRQSIDSAIREAGIATRVELSLEGTALLHRAECESRHIRSLIQVGAVVHQAHST